jgi:YHS domain-containing protein
MKKYFLFTVTVISIFFLIQGGSQAGTQILNCVVCGMETKPGSKTAFESAKDGKPVRFCSFSCAHAFHKKFPKEKMGAKDYETGKDLDTHSAYFLVGSENILKEIEFGMPPAIVAFEKEDPAKKAQARLKDGEIIKGFDALGKKYE